MIDEVRYRLRQQAAVAELGHRALTSKDLTRLMGEAAALTAMGLCVEFCKVLELLPGGEQLKLRAGVGWKQGMVGSATVSAGTDSQAGYTLLSNEPVIVEDIRKEERFSAPPLLLDHDIISGISIIIHGKEKPFGVLGAHTRRERKFSSDDIHFLQAVANIISAAIESERAEKALMEAEGRNRSIIENAIDGIYQVSAAGGFISVNSAMVKMFGYDSPGDMKSSVANVISQVYVDSSQQQRLQELIQECAVIRGFEAEVRRKDGSTFWMSTNIRPVCDETGSILYYDGFAEDITDRRQSEETVRNIAEGVSAVTGETFFRSLVEYMAKLLGMDYAVIGELVGESDVRTIAVYANGKVVDNFEYDLEGTPCYDVTHDGICSFPRQVQELYPDDNMLKEMGIESYIGTPLRDSRGNTLGIMVVLDKKPVANTEMVESLLRIFAVRASAELERKQSENEVKLLQSIALAISEADDLESALRTTLKKVCEVTGWAMGEAWIPGPDGKTLECSPAWFCSNNGLGKFRKESKLYKFTPGVGLPGRVWSSGKPAWVKDVTKDKNFPRAEIAGKVGLKAGVAIPVMMDSEVVAVMDFFLREAREQESRFIDLVSSVAAQLGTVIEKKRADEKVRDSVKRLQAALSGVIGALASTVERKDPYTAGHQQRVSRLAAALAREMGLSEESIEGLRMAGTLHDLGKIAVPAEILSKPGTISEYEFNIVKSHPQIGYEILKEIEFPWPIARIVREHHERFNGSGYPQGLSGDDIMLEARILGVADTVEAMASHRPYRPSLGMKAALEEIAKFKGKLYDPQAVDACMKLCYDKGFELE